MSCFICTENNQKSPLLQPCKCNSYVHEECIQKWIDQKKNKYCCEVCKVTYQYNTIEQFDSSLCCKDFLKWTITIFACLYTLGVDPLMVIAYTIRDTDTKKKFLVLFFGYMTNIFIKVLSVLFISIPYDYEIPYLIRISSLIFGVTTIIIQLLGQVIANPILGKGVIFYPTLATFGITLGILVGVILIGLSIYGCICKCYYYGIENWTRNKTVISNYPKSSCMV